MASYERAWTPEKDEKWRGSNNRVIRRQMKSLSVLAPSPLREFVNERTSDQLWLTIL